MRHFVLSVISLSNNETNLEHRKNIQYMISDKLKLQKTKNTEWLRYYIGI